MAKPAYLALYEELRQKILSGDYPFGSRLPGKRALAEEHGVSVITAAHALDLLADEGYISVRERSGCYVAYRSADDFPGREIPVSWSSGSDVPVSADVDDFPFSVLAKAMRRVISDQGELLLRRSPGQGILSLRQELSRYLARSRGIEASPDQIVIGAGAEYLYGIIAEAFYQGNPWAIEYPSYEMIERVYSARGIPLDLLPLTGDGLLSEALWNSPASVLHVSPYRSYPTGVTASASKRAEYLRWGNQGGRIMIEDDYESEFSIHGKPMDTLYSGSTRENVIYLNTFSRTISPALRVGYMVLPPRLLPVLQSRAGFHSCSVSVFDQYVLAELLRSGDFERHVRRVRRKLRAAGQE